MRPTRSCSRAWSLPAGTPPCRRPLHHSRRAGKVLLKRCWTRDSCINGSFGDPHILTVCASVTSIRNTLSTTPVRAATWTRCAPFPPQRIAFAAESHWACLRPGEVVCREPASRCESAGTAASEMVSAPLHRCVRLVTFETSAACTPRMSLRASAYEWPQAS